MIIILVSIIAIATIGTIYFLNQPQFGKAPSGERLEKMQKSPQFKDGKFQNINFTPMMTIRTPKKTLRSGPGMLCT